MTGPVKNNDTFITLVRVAQGDPDVRRQLVAILSLEKSQRMSILRALVDEMNLKQKPPDFIAAVSYLLREDVTEATLSLLRKELCHDPGLTESVGTQLIFAARLFIAIPATAVLCWFGALSILSLSGSIELHPLIKPVVVSVVPVIGALLGGTVVMKRNWLFLAVCMADAAIAILLILARETVNI